MNQKCELDTGYLLFLGDVDVIKFGNIRQCSLSVTIYTIDEFINYFTPVWVLFVALFNWIPLLQLYKKKQFFFIKSAKTIIVVELHILLVTQK